VSDFDPAPIMLAELDRLGYPLPVQIAAAGLRGIDKRARESLREQGLAEFTPDEYRLAVVKVMKALVEDLPQLAMDEQTERSYAVHAAAERLLVAQGKLDYSAGEYVNALNQVTRGART
jgi:hypothetical protein